MLDLHVPVGPSMPNSAIGVGFITAGLDAVVLTTKPSELHRGSIHFELAGNPRDLAEASRRASDIGGVVD